MIPVHLQQLLVQPARPVPAGGGISDVLFGKRQHTGFVDKDTAFPCAQGSDSAAVRRDNVNIADRMADIAAKTVYHMREGCQIFFNGRDQDIDGRSTVR
ncbi:hypothetical protein D3C75_1200400 [compost metagenome]